MGVIHEIRPPAPGLAQTLALMTQLTPGQMIPPGIVYGLSGLVPAQVLATAPLWRSLDVEVRRDIVLAMIEAGESDFETDFSMIGMLVLDDDDPQVRALAIELCAYIEDLAHMNTLFEIAQHDNSDIVRSAAMKALGAFVLQGELGQAPGDAVDPIVEYLVRIVRDRREASEVRARALEAIGYSGNKSVVAEIRKAYDGDNDRLKTAAIFAMGASGDEQWAETVVNELEKGSAENRYEAARAAGELSLQEAVRPLSKLVFAEDSEIVREAIWALGEIGGKEAVRVLEAALEQSEANGDDDLADLVEDALDNANAAAGFVFGFDSPDEMN